MTEEMKNRLSKVLEETTDPITGLSISDLHVVQGIKFNTVSESFLVYLDTERTSLGKCTCFFFLGKVEIEDLIIKALKRVFPSYNIGFSYLAEPG